MQNPYVVMTAKGYETLAMPFVPAPEPTRAQERWYMPAFGNRRRSEKNQELTDFFIALTGDNEDR